MTEEEKILLTEFTSEFFNVSEDKAEEFIHKMRSIIETERKRGF